MTIKPNPNWRGDPTFLPEVFRAFGVKFREYPGWKDWGMGDFGTIQGVIWHHTGAANTSPEYIRNNPRLSNGLSSQFHTAPDGTQTILGAGIAWHAGRGSHPGWPTNDANRVSLGFEMQHDGISPWPDVQLESTRLATAAILWFLGKRATTHTMLAHWEYSMNAQGKWDPGAGNGKPGAVMNMNAQRDKVNWLIDNYTRTGNPYGKPAPAPKTAVALGPLTEKYFTDFTTGYIGPLISDVKDIRQQITGGRDKGQYPGWDLTELHKNYAARGGGNGTLPEIAAVTLLELRDLRAAVRRLEHKETKR